MRHPGQRVSVRQVVNRWALLDESTAIDEMWVHTKFLKPETPSSVAAEVTTAAAAENAASAVAEKSTAAAAAPMPVANDMAARLRSLLHDHKKISFDAGTMVVVEGLSGRPELNGKRGRVLNFVADKGRFAVELPKRGGELASERVLLKPANLRPAPAEPEAPASKAPSAPAATGDSKDMSSWEDEMIELVKQVELSEEDVRNCPPLSCILGAVTGKAGTGSGVR